VTATVSSTPTPTLSFSNTATATAPAGVTDPNTANNSATASGIIGVAEDCATTCGPLTTGSTNTGSTTTTGSGGSSGTLQEALFSGSLGCTYQTGDLHMDTHISEVLLSSGAFSKTVSLEYPAIAGAPTIDPRDTTNGPDGDRDFDDVVWNSQVCFQAAPGVTFKTRSGSLANVGLLPNCPTPLSSATGPCVDRAHSALINVGAAGTINYDVVLVVFIPAGAAGDPRMN
jgi:hypothetical protein